MIYNYSDYLRQSLKVIPSFSIRLYDCKHFLILYSIASLLVLKLARIEGNQMLTISEKLRQHISKFVSQYINLYISLEIQIIVSKQRSVLEALLNFLECLLSLVGSYQLARLLTILYTFKQVYHKGCDLGIALNKYLIKVSESKKYLNIFINSRVRLFLNSYYSRRVYKDIISANLKT